jgi:hypothetical protein
MFYRGYGFEIFTKIRIDSPEVIGQEAGPIESFGDDKPIFFTCRVSTILTRKLLLSS